MYLNIINNINHESKRKSKKIEHNFEYAKDENKNETNHMINDNNNFSYYSIFYGDLTKNWIQLKN